MTLTETPDSQVFRVTLKSGESKTFEWPELRFFLEDEEQREFSETVKLDFDLSSATSDEHSER